MASSSFSNDPPDSPSILTPIPLPPLAAIAKEEYHSFYKRDRDLFKRLVLRQGRDWIESARAIALILWLESSGQARGLVAYVICLDDMFICALIDELVMCLRCMDKEDEYAMLSNNSIMGDDTNFIPLIKSLTKDKLTLKYFYGNRERIIPVVVKNFKDVWTHAFEDVVTAVIGDKQIHDNQEKKTGMMINEGQNNYFGMSHMDLNPRVTSPAPLYYHAYYRGRSFAPIGLGRLMSTSDDPNGTRRPNPPGLESHYDPIATTLTPRYYYYSYGGGTSALIKTDKPMHVCNINDANESNPPGVRSHYKPMVATLNSLYCSNGYGNGSSAPIRIEKLMSIGSTNVSGSDLPKIELHNDVVANSLDPSYYHSDYLGVLPSLVQKGKALSISSGSVASESGFSGFESYYDPMAIVSPLSYYYDSYGGGDSSNFVKCGKNMSIGSSKDASGPDLPRIESNYVPMMTTIAPSYYYDGGLQASISMNKLIIVDGNTSGAYQFDPPGNEMHKKFLREKVLSQRLNQVKIDDASSKGGNGDDDVNSDNALTSNAPQMSDNIPQDERTIFLTFSKGYPIFEHEIIDYFTRKFGDCVEAIYMQEVVEGQQPLFARMVLYNLSFLHTMLNKANIAKFNINGKHVWARKYITKHAPSLSRSWLNHRA